jgi:uncharacterized membrane protein YjfL (UPF0719 family)
MAAVIVSIATVVQSGVLQVTRGFDANQGLDVSLIIIAKGIINLLVGIGAAILAIYYALRTLDKTTKEIDEMEEIARGNVSVAVIMAGVLVAVSFVISAAVSGISNALNAI